MKLRFRADMKDILIFASFCVVLLYFSAITVLNISSMSSYSEIHGLNPLPAFGGEYILPTMVFFTVALIVIISSVTSYFFEMEKGVGVAVGKKQEKGYSRWLKDSEMKKELKLVIPNSKINDKAGIPIINNGKEIWVDNGEYHSLIIGSTGSGKTQIIVHPLVKILAKKGESMIITDPKGEIYMENAEMLREKGYNIVLLNFREPQRGNAWNPLTLPYNLYKEGNQDKANELLDDLAKNILYDESSKGQDPFWENTSADYFAGLALALFEDAAESQINLNSINLMTSVGEEKSMGTTYMKEYFSHKDQTSPAYINVVSTLMAPADTKGSILSVFKQKIKLFSSRENISEMLSHSDFDMKEIGRKKTAVFLVVHDEKKTYHSLVTIFIKQVYESLIDVAQENGGKLSYRTNFILDEFANMPPLKDVTTMVTAARSRNIRFNFIIQNFAQLYQVYGKENGETIKGNCGNIIYLISSELSALEEISKMCGEVKSKEKEKTSSTPLVTVSDLQRLKQFETIFIRTRMMPFKTKLTPNYQMNWGETFPKSEYMSREKEPVNVFDLKKYVEDKRKDMFEETPGIGANDFKGMFDRPMAPPSGPPKGLDIDELIKRIDQKIADLEEEEKKADQEPVKEESKFTPIQPDMSAFNKLMQSMDEKISEEKPSAEPKIEDAIKRIEQSLKESNPIEKEIPEVKVIEKEIIEKPVVTEVVKEITVPATPVRQIPITRTERVEQKPLETKKIEDEVADTDDQFFDDFFSEDEDE